MIFGYIGPLGPMIKGLLGHLGCESGGAVSRNDGTPAPGLSQMALEGD